MNDEQEVEEEKEREIDGSEMETSEERISHRDVFGL